MDSLKFNAAALAILADSCRGWGAEAGATIKPVTDGELSSATGFEALR